VVDSLHGEATLRRHPEAVRQAALADGLLLSKTDLTAPTATLLAQLGALNPDAPTHSTREASPDVLFAGATVSARLDSAPTARHTAGIESFALQRDRPVPALALTLLLEALTEHCGARLLRMKGLVNIAEMPGQPAVIHGVQHVFAAPEFLDRWPSDDHTTRMAFIGRGVPRYFPTRLLDAIEQEVREEMLQAASLR
jgi:G3E family GTPase